jgi:hypothetical protein
MFNTHHKRLTTWGGGLTVTAIICAFGLTVGLRLVSVQATEPPEPCYNTATCNPTGDCIAYYGPTLGTQTGAYAAPPNDHGCGISTVNDAQLPCGPVLAVAWSNCTN